MEEINFQHILKMIFLSTREAGRKFSNVLLKLDGRGMFIPNLWKGVEDSCWKDLISLRIGVKTNICSLIFQFFQAEWFVEVFCLMHHNYFYFCILDTVQTDDVKKIYPIFAWLFLSQASFTCTFRLLP